MDGSGSRDDFFAVVGEPWRVAVGGVDVFEGDGEVDNVEVEVGDAPVLELLFADRLDDGVVVVGVPEFGDEEEIFALYYTFLDGAGDTLAAFDFVAVVCGKIRYRWKPQFKVFDTTTARTYRMHRRRDDSQF